MNSLLENFDNNIKYRTDVNRFIEKFPHENLVNQIFIHRKDDQFGINLSEKL